MSLISEVTPTHRLLVMDLVQQAGIDVSDWANYDGRPAANPKYCYEWSFTQPGKVVVLNLWLSKMKKSGGTLIQRPSLRKESRSKDRSIRSAVWAKRSDRMAQAIRQAIEDRLPVRVIVCKGVFRDSSNPKSGPTRVTGRMLDPKPWAVTEYDPITGQSTITRGAVPVRFVDQFDLARKSSDGDNRRTVTSQVYERDGIVRQRALARANGRCQWCKKKGFRTAKGEIFLETHHVIPLSEDGLDAEENVIALCPNHHREAHLGRDSNSMRQEMLRRIALTSRR